jgi:GNAT superfamily N-acetyltransferase
MKHGLRPGNLSDVRALVRLHESCSDETIVRRYLSPLPTLTTRLATRLLCPPGGFSVVAEQDQGIIGIATVSPAPDQAAGLGMQVADLGMLVADQFQRRGIGTALLVAAARQASHTFEEFALTIHACNAGVLHTVYSAGLRARVRNRNGTLTVTVPLTGLTRPQPATPTASSSVR